MADTPITGTTQGLPTFNPNFNSQTDTIAPVGTPIVPATLNSNNTIPASPITLPPAGPTLPSSIVNNSTIPIPASIINTSTEQTPAESQNQSVLDKISELTGTNQTLNQFTNTNEANANVPGLTKIYNDLGNQLNGLNDQATKLQNDASVGGTIENTNDTAAAGRMSLAGEAPHTAADLRMNQIQQAAIATQALTVKSAIYYAQGNLALAKDAADKAAQGAFDSQQNKLDTLNAQLDAIKPQMTKEENAQAAVVQANLADRQAKLDQQKQDYSSGLGLINAAMKNAGTDPQAQLAIQQAQSLDKTDPNYLQNVGALLTKYQVDPIATQQALANLQLTRSDINKNNVDAAKTAADTLVSNADNVNVPQVVASLMSSPNTTSNQLSGLTPNGLIQKAQEAMTHNGNIQGMGLGATGKVGAQRQLITNYAGYLADKLGVTIPQITQLYAANSKAIGEVVSRVAKIDTTSSTLSGQFPRLAQLAANVGNLGITESDLTSGKANIAKKFGSVDAGNYAELIQTTRADYSALQAAVGGSRGGTFFAQNAEQAIPLGLTPDQYMGLAQTIQGSADIANQSSATTVQGLLGTAGGNTNYGTTVMTGPDGSQYNVPNDKITIFQQNGYK